MEKNQKLGRTKKFATVHTKVCFRERRTPIGKKGLRKNKKSKKKAKNDREAKILEILPNCPIRAGRLLINSTLPALDEEPQKTPKTAKTDKTKTTKNTPQKLQLNLKMRQRIESHKTLLEVSSNSVGQLLVVFTLKSKKLKKYKKGLEPRIVFPNISVSTCCIIKLKGFIKLYGVSCLHCFQLEDEVLIELIGRRAIKSSDYTRTAFFVKHDSDASSAVLKIEKLLRSVLGRLESSSQYSEEKIVSRVKNLLKKRYLRGCFLAEVSPSDQFLEIRKKFIIEESGAYEEVDGGKEGEGGRQKGKNLKEREVGGRKLLDPCFSLQPLPSVDMMFLDLQMDFHVEFEKYIARMKDSYSFEKLNFEIREQIPEDEDSEEWSKSILSETGYSSVSFFSHQIGQNKFRMKYLELDIPATPDHSKSPKGHKKASNSAKKLLKTQKLTKRAKNAKVEKSEIEAFLIGYQGIYMDSLGDGINTQSQTFSKFNQFLDAEFFNEDLSVTATLIQERSDQLFLFLGNTSHGSSGSCLIDETGKLLGMNFGYYNDDVEIENESCDEGYEPSQRAPEGKFCDQKKDEFAFDMEVEEEVKNRNLIKNRNLAVSFSHDVVKRFVLTEIQGKKLEKDLLSGQLGEATGGGPVTFKSFMNLKEMRNDALKKKNRRLSESSGGISAQSDGVGVRRCKTIIEVDSPYLRDGEMDRMGVGSEKPGKEDLSEFVSPPVSEGGVRRGRKERQFLRGLESLKEKEAHKNGKKLGESRRRFRKPGVGRRVDVFTKKRIRK